MIYVDARLSSAMVLKSRIVYNYIWLEDMPVAQFTEKYSWAGAYLPAESQLTYLHADHLNTAQIGTGDSSPPAPAPSVDDAVIWRLNSNAYGVAWETQNPDGDSVDVKMALRFPGQIYYGLGGLNYNYFRTYDTVAGRYLESDPIGLKGGRNSYSYADQNPMGFVDPDGRTPVHVARAAGLVACFAFDVWQWYQFEAYMDEVEESLAYIDGWIERLECTEPLTKAERDNRSCTLLQLKKWRTLEFIRKSATYAAGGAITTGVTAGCAVLGSKIRRFPQ